MRSVTGCMAALVALLFAFSALARSPRKGTIKIPRKAPATLSITSDPPAGVTIDGGYRGRTPLNLKINPGTRRVVLETMDGRREVRTVDARPGAALSISHTFPSPAAAAGKRGSSAVETDDGTPYLEALERQRPDLPRSSSRP